jgi:hypothetical protein
VTPLIQTRIAEHQADRHGNCLATCICMLLDMPDVLEDLSDLMELADTAEQQRIIANRFLHPHGWTILTLINFDDGEDRMAELSVSLLPRIASGMGPRGMFHSIVQMPDGTFHDPHPSGEGLHEHINRFDVLVPIGE